ncbi:IS21 family transposase [Desulfosporosinus sp. BICA1-9]|uniref:IS21 family transposase n=1 Tax=Desulfosporosinus sp. BICA1-9 TaxID=1531958 RepID=UPI00054BA9FB|nr:IS21 family transposase [Desulfosporosinus sp. BICA1-9]KJS89141.1 MAG: hypothetical protein JL57_09000 [Desulfosporosinus sp. BICA1-9]
MAIELSLYKQIRRLYNEGHSQRHIARILNCSRKIVKKYCQGEILHDAKKSTPLKVTPPLPQARGAIEKELITMLDENKTLPRKQQRTAKTMWQELTKKGFIVGESTIRRHVRILVQKHPEAFVPLYFEPGEAMQVDWGDAKAWMDSVNTGVSLFVTILPYSYGLYTSVFPDKTNPSFFTGHVKAFEFFGGVPKRCIYDNLRSAVAKGSGTTAVKQEEFKNLEAHYSFDSDFCNVAAGWEKGGIENAVAIIRRIAFTPMPCVKNFAELQQHVDACCVKYIETHKIRYRSASIKSMFTEERQCLNPLPITPLDTAKSIPALVCHDLTVLLEGTRYSVPFDYVGERVTLKVSPFTVSIWHRGKEICTHNKTLIKGDHQYITDHYLELLSRKPRALMNAAPLKKGVMPEELKRFLKVCRAKDKEEQLLQIMLLGRTVGTDELLWAVDKANLTGSPTHQLVCYYLGVATAATEVLPCITVEHADLSEYDGLMGGDKA